MGCHTWHYKKDNRPYTEVKESVIKNKLESIQSWKELLNIKSNIKENKDKDWFPEATVEQVNHNIKVLERQIQIIKKDLCKVAVYNHQSGVSIVHNDIPYIECDEFHDTFRIGGYPEDKLLSYEDTMRFIEDKVSEGWNIELFKNKITGKTRLEEFWEKYPDGLIDFG